LIVYERENNFVMVEQNNHAILSGDLAKNWRDDLFVGMDRKPDVIFAITQHDRAWVGLDETPLWDDAAKAPYSFIDLPSRLKLPHYQVGIDAVERRNKYAAFLCSCHYASFFDESADSAEQAYYRHELERQNRLRPELNVSDEELHIHLNILKFLDRLSIYICINEPGVAKEQEFFWYRDGFPGSEQLLGAHGQRINAYWLDEGRIGLTRFPFASTFTVSVPAKIVSKRDIEQLGIAVAYRQTPVTLRTVELRTM
jgi:hypothetical protein